jgi:prepilin-type N-terminal cleavage/methylation domain-containing protein
MIRIRRERFTLIELLVVVAIIASLAALLLPALGRARYLARLTVCSGNLDQMGLGVLSYTVDHDSYYPYRKPGAPTDNWSTPFLLNRPNTPTADDRPMFLDYMGTLTIFMCPMTQTPINLAAVNGPAATSSYSLRFGSIMRFGDPATGMYREGDRPVWGGKSFSVLASDAERYASGFSGQTNRHTTHPDRRFLTPFFHSDSTQIVSMWWVSGTTVRGRIERHFLMDDGSVQRLQLDDTDHKVAVVPWHPVSSFTVAQVHTFLPPD